MQVIKLGQKLNCPIVVCLGFFGCMHKGHIELLNRAKLRAKQTDSKVALFTFSNNHLAVLGKDNYTAYTYDERLVIYRSLGVDVVITAEFNAEFKSLSGKQFLSQFTAYDLQGVVCGFDHHCGSDGIDCKEISNYLADVCSVDIADQVTIDGQKVSTTLVRTYLQQGNINKANSLLSEPFFLLGKVVHGRGVGKTLGFPTANIQVDAEKLLPYGVYGGYIDIDDQSFRAITNIGKVPTFNINCNSVEVFVLNYNGNLYDKTVKVSLTKFLRPIKRFNSADELRKQLNHDKETVLND